MNEWKASLNGLDMCGHVCEMEEQRMMGTWLLKTQENGTWRYNNYNYSF